MIYFGIDTETPMGSLKVIATNLEAKEVSTFSEICDFLLQYKYRGAIFFGFNLRFDGEAILKTTGDMEFLKKIYKDGGEGVWFNDTLKVRWISAKFLQICRGNRKKNKTHHCIRMYDIAQFYEGWTLDKVARKYLGDYKNPVDAERLGKEKGYYEANKAEVLEYCRKDAELTLRAAMLKKESIETVPMKKGKLTFRNPVSQAKIAEIYIKDNFKYPIVPKGIDAFHYFAFKSYHGGLFSTLKRGYLKQPLYLYDINSAYPFQMKDLEHWGNGTFKITPAPDKYDTKYGWFFCEFDCEWIPYTEMTKGFNIEIRIKKHDIKEEIKINHKRKLYPEGKRKQWLTKIEYEWLKKHNYFVHFIAGFVWLKLNDKYPSPFGWMEDVYKRRKEIVAKDEDDVNQHALKIVLNGTYGKTAQAKHGFGSLTNFFYCSYTTAGTRLQICDVVLQNPEVIVELATDSILSLAPLNVRVSEKLGDWSLKKYDRGLLVGSGIRQLWMADKSTTAARGLTDKSNWDMLKAMEENKNEDWLYHVKERPLHLGEIIFHHKKLALKDLIVFTKVEKKLNVNTDNKREWARRYRDFRDLLESDYMSSIPLNINEIEKDKA